MRWSLLYIRTPYVRTYLGGVHQSCMQQGLQLSITMVCNCTYGTTSHYIPHSYVGGTVT